MPAWLKYMYLIISIFFYILLNMFFSLSLARSRSLALSVILILFLWRISIWVLHECVEKQLNVTNNWSKIVSIKKLFQMYFVFKSSQNDTRLMMEMTYFIRL